MLTGRIKIKSDVTFWFIFFSSVKTLYCQCWKKAHCVCVKIVKQICPIISTTCERWGPRASPGLVVPSPARAGWAGSTSSKTYQSWRERRSLPNNLAVKISVVAWEDSSLTVEALEINVLAWEEDSCPIQSCSSMKGSLYNHSGAVNQCETCEDPSSTIIGLETNVVAWEEIPLKSLGTAISSDCGIGNQCGFAWEKPSPTIVGLKSTFQTAIPPIDHTSSSVRNSPYTIIFHLLRLPFWSKISASENVLCV